MLTKFFTIIFSAHIVQVLGMAVFANEAVGTSRRWAFRPRLSLWLWRSAAVVVFFTVMVLAAAIADAHGWYGIIWFSPVVNAAFWVLLTTHTILTRRAAQRSPSLVDAAVESLNSLLEDMARSRAKADDALAAIDTSQG